MPEVLESAVPEVSATEPEVSSTETVETSPESPVETTETTETQDTQQETEETQGDGRQMPAKFKAYLKELQATDPRLAKQLRGEWYAMQQIRASYPGGMKDIQRVAQISEQIGGEEGIAAIEAERAEWSALDEQFTTGDPKFIENIASQDPQAFAKLVPHAIAHYATQDPEGYSHLMAGVVVNTVKDIATKMYNALVQAETTKPLAEELAKWFNGLDELARTKPVQKVDPEREKLTKEREEWENQKAQDYHESVTNEMRTFNSKQIDSDLTAQLTKAGRNAQQFQKQNAESYEILRKNCNESIQGILSKDQTFLKQYGAILQTGDKAKALQFAQAKIRMVSPEAVKRTLRAFLAFGGTPATKAPVPANGNGNGTAAKLTGELQLSKMPDAKEIDWSRTDKSMILQGKAFIKTQKQMVRF